MDIMEYAFLFSLITVAAFITYTVNEVANAIHSYLHDNNEF